METGPIFIGGLANSGKTELRLLLEAHPNLSFTRRTYMWTRYYQRFGDLAIPTNFERCLAQMLQNKHILALDPDLERIRKEFLRGAPTYAQLFALFHSHYAERMGKLRWGDQLGSIEQYAEPIMAGYPKAKIIQMIRNPRHIYEEANARSRQRLGKVGWLLADWLGSVQLARRNIRRFPANYKIVSYEELFMHPERMLREILDFIGEEHVPQKVFELLCELKAAAIRSGAEMSIRELAFVQRYARSELLSLGYSLETTQLSLHDRLLFLFLDWPANRAGMLAWQTTKGKRM